MTQLNSAATVNETITPDTTRRRVEQSIQVALPSTENELSTENGLSTEKELSSEKELSTESDTPLIFRSRNPRVPPSTTPQLAQRVQLDSATEGSSLPPTLPKMAGFEAERFVDCPVIVHHSQLGWLELRCNVCGGNCQEKSEKYLLGIAGVRRHLAHKHSKTSNGTRHFDTDYILGNCVRKLTSAEVDTYAKAIEKGRDPIVKRPCSADGDDFETDRSAPEAKPPQHKQPLKRVREEELKVDGLPDLLAGTLPSKRARHGTYNSASPATPQSRSAKQRATRKMNVPQYTRDQDNESSKASPVKIISEPSCPAVCHHPTEGPFILVCPFCKGNAYVSPESLKLEFLDPPKLYSHIRQAHPDALQKANSSGEPMHFSAFQQDYMALHCVNQWLTTEEFENLIKATASGFRYSPLTRVPVKTIVDDHDKKFPTLCFEHFSSVVLREDLKWVDLRCPHCSTNVPRGHKKHFQGIKGFMRHMTRMHSFDPPDPSHSWKWLLDQCTQWSDHPEVDVEKLEAGLNVIPLVGSDTFIVKLKVPSLFYE